MRLSLAFFLGLLFLTSFALAEGNGDVLDALSKVQEVSSHRKHFSVTYEQTRFKALVKKTVAEKGTLEFSAPKSFRWEISSPSKEIYVSNGKDFWKYSEIAKHAQKLKADTGELAVLDVLFRPGNLKRDYKVERWVAPVDDGANGSDVVSSVPPASKQGKLFVLLIPRVKSKQKALYLIIDQEKGFVDELRIVHENGNRVRTVFGALSEVNIPAAHFEFVPPPGTAIDK